MHKICCLFPCDWSATKTSAKHNPQLWLDFNVPLKCIIRTSSCITCELNSLFTSGSLSVVFLSVETFKYLIAADGEQDVLLGDLEACGEHGFEVSLVPVLPKTSYFSSAGHLHPEHHISSGQPRERKLRDLEDIWLKAIRDAQSDEKTKVI